MAKSDTSTLKPERVIALIAGESGAGKSFAVANCKKALIFDTDIGGGLSYADARIKANGSERIEVGSYLEVIAEIEKRKRDGSLKNITTLAIDHLSTLQQEAVIRHNPKMAEDYGKSYSRATSEWRKIRDIVRIGDFNLICTSHLKALYADNKAVGMQADASKNVEGDMMIAIHLKRPALGRVSSTNLSTAEVRKWRRDPDDPRGEVPDTFPFTLENLIALHGFSLEGARHEIPMASEEQVQQIEKLLGVVRLADGEWDKVMSKAKAESIAEFTQEAADKTLRWLKDKLEKAGA